MTPREKMLEKVVHTNRKYDNLFVLTISTDSGDPVVQGYYENDPSDDGEEPASLQIGAQVINNLHIALIGGAMGGDGEDDDGDDKEEPQRGSNVH